jgi:hypothetical protein
MLSYALFYSKISLLLSGEDIRVTSINDGEDRAIEKLSASGSKSSVISIVVVYTGLCKHCKVLDFGSAKRRAVVGDEDHLCLGSAHALDRSLVSEVSLS